MKKSILILLAFIPALLLTSCVTDNIYSPGYTKSPGFGRSYVSSTGYGVGDYGLGFGANYNPQSGLEDFGLEQ